MLTCMRVRCYPPIKHSCPPLRHDFLLLFGRHSCGFFDLTFPFLMGHRFSSFRVPSFPSSFQSFFLLSCSVKKAIHNSRDAR